MRSLFVFLLLSGLAAAEPGQLLLTTTSDRDAKQEKLYLKTGEGGAPVGLVVLRADGSLESFTLEDLSSGAVLKAEKGNPVVTIRCGELSPTEGGKIAVRYLYSAVPPASFRNFSLELRRQGGLWRLFRKGAGEPLEGMHFLVNRVRRLGVVGIRGVEFR